MYWGYVCAPVNSWGSPASRFPCFLESGINGPLPNQGVRC
jgi:hypothetical protein